MPTLKNILVRQASIPANIEAKLPTGVPKISQIMTSFAEAIPINPELPEIPVVPGGEPPVAVIDIIRGIPEAPTVPGIPGAQGATALRFGGGRFRSAPPTPMVTPVIGGGYRSI